MNFSVVVSAANAQELAKATEKVAQSLSELVGGDGFTANAVITIGGAVIVEDAKEGGCEPLPDDIHVHGGVKYRKVYRMAKEGELILVIGEDGGHNCEIGSVVTVDEVDEDDDSVRDKETGDWLWHGRDEYLVLEPLEGGA